MKHGQLNRAPASAFKRIFQATRALLLLVLLTTSTSFAAQAAAESPRTLNLESFALIGDAGFTGRAVERLRSSIAQQGLHQLILPGDNLYTTKLGYARVWQPWRNEGFTFPVVAIGNHTAGYAKEASYFEMPGEYYSKAIGDSRFIVLNSNHNATVREQADFLARELESAQEKFLFVVFHHPPYTISTRHSASEKRGFHELVRPLLQRYSERITALIVGHDHIAGLYALNSLPMIVAGAGVEALKPQPTSRREGDVFIQSEWLFDRTQTWPRLDINENSGEVRVRFIEVKSGRLACSALISTRPAQLDSGCKN